MLSVIRFSAFVTGDALNSYGAEVNAVMPGLFTGPDRVANRFSCTISEAGDWRAQCDSIQRAISALSLIARNAVANGVQIELDIAVDPEDYSDRLLTEFPLEEQLLRAVLENSIGFRLSLYGGHRGGHGEWRQDNP
jgi:hypothetical protein